MTLTAAEEAPAPPAQECLPRSQACTARPRAHAQLVDQPTGRLEADAIDLAGRLSAGAYELLVLVGEIDARGSFATWGSLSCAAWLADVCGVEVCTARTQVRVARVMRQYPALDEAMAAGDISYTKARVLAACLTPDNAEALLGIAERTPAGKLGAAIAAWCQRNEDPEQIKRRQHESRSVSWRTEPSGTVLITARLTPEVAGPVLAAIDAEVTRNHAPAGASLPHQRADALAGLVTNGGSAVTAEVVVHVTKKATTSPTARPCPITRSVNCCPTRSCRCSSTTRNAIPSTPALDGDTPPAANAASWTRRSASALTPDATPPPSSSTTTCTRMTRAGRPCSTTSNASAAPTTGRRR